MVEFHVNFKMLFFFLFLLFVRTIIIHNYLGSAWKIPYTKDFSKSVDQFCGRLDLKHSTYIFYSNSVTPIGIKLEICLYRKQKQIKKDLFSHVTYIRW